MTITTNKQNSQHQADDEAIELATMLRRERRFLHRAMKLYWQLSFHLTRIIEHLPQRYPETNNHVLNFGCGNQFHNGAVNSDLFGIHRFLKNKRRPDIYWTGTTNIPALHEYFTGIVCEHVIEHILPDALPSLFKHLLNTLKEGGSLVISFPDAQKILHSNNTQGFTSPIVSLNSVIYRYGHTFMYDTDIVRKLLSRAGFSYTKVTTLSNAPLQIFLDTNREPESSYILAIK